MSKFWIPFTNKNAILKNYSAMQLDRNSSKTDTFHDITTYEPRE